MPLELKSRLDLQAKSQRVSVENLANYLLTTQLSQLETLTVIEQRMKGKKLGDLKQKVTALLDKVLHKPGMPEWDRL